MWQLLFLTLAAADDFEIYHVYSPPSARPNPAFSYAFSAISVLVLLTFFFLLTRIKLNIELQKAYGLLRSITFYTSTTLLATLSLFHFWVNGTLLIEIAVLLFFVYDDFLQHGGSLRLESLNAKSQ